MDEFADFDDFASDDYVKNDDFQAALGIGSNDNAILWRCPGQRLIYKNVRVSLSH